MPSGISNKSQIAAAFRTVAKQIERDLELRVQSVAQEALRQLIANTPEVTGETVGNWQVGVGADVPSDVSTTPDPDGARALLQGAAKIKTAGIGQHITIVNNAPQMGPLAAGSSDQAPDGWIERSAFAAMAKGSK